MNSEEIQASLDKARQLIYNDSELAARQVITNLIYDLQQQKAEGNKE
jgi:hypothetical protein